MTSWQKIKSLIQIMHHIPSACLQMMSYSHDFKTEAKGHHYTETETNKTAKEHKCAVSWKLCTKAA
jgi:hypothetical protein